MTTPMQALEDGANPVDDVSLADGRHDCGHRCCDERDDPFHGHFLPADDCPRCAPDDRCAACGGRHCSQCGAALRALGPRCAKCLVASLAGDE